MAKIDMKVVVIGQEYVGKSAVVCRYMNDNFKTPGYSTIGASFEKKNVEVNGETLLIAIWDTCGHDRAESLSRMYCKKSHAGIVCYDITDRKSLNKAEFLAKWLHEAEPDCHIFLCGTKLDMVLEDRKRRQVMYEDVMNLAKEFGADVFETSSKTGENVGELFYAVVLDFVKTRTKRSTDGQSLKLDSKKDKPDNCKSS